MVRFERVSTVSGNDPSGGTIPQIPRRCKRNAGLVQLDIVRMDDWELIMQIWISIA